MFRIVVGALFCLGGFAVGRRLWPAMATRRGALIYGCLSIIGVGSWAVPYLMGRGLLGTTGEVSRWLKFGSSAWLVAAVLLTLAGTALLLMGRSAGIVSRLLVRRTESESIDESRRALLARIGPAVPVTALAIGAGGVANTSGAFTLRRADVKLRGLPKALDGFRIGQITDIHVGAFIDAAYVHRAVEAMNAEQVDLQVMTGDLIDDFAQLDATFGALEQCRAPHGMLAILGNHEHWRGLDEILPRYEAIAAKGGPVRLLVNESVVLQHNGAKIRVVGTDYPITRFREDKRHVMQRQAEVAFAGVQLDETVLCLAHHPDFFPFAAERDARLTLSGHTHGGQIAVLGFPVFSFAFKHMLGWYREGDQRLYVSGGTGHWLPFRIGIPTEVTILTLRAV